MKIKGMNDMDISNKVPDFFVFDHVSIEDAFKRITHMSIGAHPDDLEIMSYDGILKCYKQKDKWFFGVVVTDGANILKNNVYETFSNDEIKKIRKQEQIEAAKIGKYGLLTLMNHQSDDVKDAKNELIINELYELINKAKPEVLYTHNVIDRHDTHLGLAIKVIKAIRKMDKKDRPKKLYGCEVWRNLDFLMNEDKISFDTSGNNHLESKILKVFKSQIHKGKSYDLATIGRRQAHATFGESHVIDQSKNISLAIDMTALIEDEHLDIVSFTVNLMNHVVKDVKERIEKMNE